MRRAAMACLGKSVMLTMGSGQWGAASRLIEQLDGVPADPAVAAIRARRLIDEGDLAARTRCSAGSTLPGRPPDVRASVRHARWLWDGAPATVTPCTPTLHDIQADSETPPVMRDIAETFIDASPLAGRRATMLALAQRLTSMANSQAAAGLQFYSAVSLHNATVAYLHAGDPRGRIANRRRRDIAAFDLLPFTAAERYSTHSRDRDGAP